MYLKLSEFSQNEWTNKEQPLYRFDITNHFLKDGETLLDVGAGTLDLYKYLIKKGRTFNYIGIEPNKKLKSFHQESVPIIYKDFLDMEISKPIADIVVAWGITPYFSFRKNYTKWRSIYRMIDNLFLSAKRLFLFDVWVDDKFSYKGRDESVLTYDPELINKFLRTLNISSMSMTYPLVKDKEAAFFVVYK